MARQLLFTLNEEGDKVPLKTDQAGHLVISGSVGIEESLVEEGEDWEDE